MRILHLTNELRNNGTGITNVVVDLAIEQARAGHDVHVVCAVVGPTYRDLCREHGVRVWRIADQRRPSRLPVALAQFTAVLRRRAPDVLHVHTVRALALATVVRPLVPRVPVVSTVHNEYQRSSALMMLTHRTVCVSDAVRHGMRRYPAPRRGLRTVRNGVLGSARVTDVDEVVPHRLRRPAVVYVGGLLPVKGVDVLLAAFDRLGPEIAGAHLYLVGNRDNPELEAHAARLGSAARIHFVDFDPDPRRYMKAADVVVLPSRQESLGLALIEARSCGASVVGSDTGGIPEALDAGEAGVLVPPGDPGALARALAGLLADPAERARLGRRAGRHLEGFSTHAMAEGYQAVYGELVRRHSRGHPGRSRSRPGRDPVGTPGTGGHDGTIPHDAPRRDMP